MRILQISSVPVTYPGGTEKVVLDLSKELSKKNEVTILQTNLYEEKKEFKKFSKIGKIKVITCKNDHFFGGFGYSKEFKKELKKIYKNFDLIHVHGHGRFTSTYVLKSIGKKKPIIYTAHGFFHSAKGSKIKKIYNLFFRFLSNKPKCLTALTGLEKQNYLKLGAKENKIKIVPNWIDLKKFSKGKKIKLPFKNNFPVLLFVGRVHESKGLQYVLKSIQNLDVNLLIVGKDHGYKNQLEKIVSELKIEEKVQFAGAVSNSQLKNFYNSSNFFILFSEWEGFGIVVLEAMSAGLPVIASNRGALPILIKSRENGLIVRFPNISDLEEKIKLMIENKKLSKKIKENGNKFVRQFEMSKILKKYEEIYTDAIRK